MPRLETIAAAIKASKVFELAEMDFLSMAEFLKATAGITTDTKELGEVSDAGLMK